MIRLCTLLGMLLMVSLVKGQRLAVESCSHPTRGLYTLHGTADGRNEYRAERSFDIAVSPEIVRWNPTANEGAGRWEIVQSTIYGSVVVAHTNQNTAPDPPETGWTGNGGCDETNVKVYQPESATINGGSWSDPASWSTGRVPRQYDDVVVGEGSPTSLDADVIIHDFTFLGAFPVLSGSKKLTVLGNASGSGLLYVEELVMAGTDPQTLGVFPSEGKLVINNGKGVSLSAGYSPFFLSNSYFPVVSLESGCLYLGDFSLSVSEIIGAGPTKHIVTNGSGTFSINGSVGLDSQYQKEFPVSHTGTDYKPLLITLQPNSASGHGPEGTKPYYAKLQFSVKVSPLVETPPHAGYVDAQWEITKAVVPSQFINTFPYREGLFTVRFSWDTPDESQHFDGLGSIVAKRYNTTDLSWETKGLNGVRQGTGPYSHTITHQNEFSSWGIFNLEDPLPVTLSSFTVDKEVTVALLAWQTVSEKDSDRFEIEHSPDAKTWSQISTVLAGGQSNTLKNYRYRHATPIRGVNYYRLKMVDVDGATAYSEVKSIGFGNDFMKTQVSPNPATDRLSVNVPDGKNLRSVTLLDVAGRQVQMIPPSRANRPIEISHLPAGIYLLRIDYQNSPVETHRVVIGR